MWSEGGTGGVVVLQDDATFGTTTTITVHCTGFKFAVGFPDFSKTSLTALKVDSIQ